jgi:Mrp family chromosome partitioning ATPase
MAKIIEALRKSDTLLIPLAEKEPLPRPYRPEPSSTVPEPAEEIPFIEVGGKNTPTEASASVLACSLKKSARVQVQDRPVRQSLAEPSPSETARYPITALKFIPIPGEPVPLRLPHERFSSDLVALHHPDFPVSAQYRTLAEALANQMPAGQPQVLLFAAAVPSIDTASVVLNLGITRAGQTGFRVVVVDVNLHKPGVASRLGIPETPGLQDVLAGRIALKGALQETGHNCLFALTAGKPADDCLNPLAGEALRSVLRHLRGRFDWVLIGGPCWDGRPDVVAVGAACDAVYLLLPEETGVTPGTQSLMDLISQQGSRLRGCIHLRAE